MQELRGATRRFSTDRGAIEHQRLGSETGGERCDDIQNVAVCRYAQDHDIRIASQGFGRLGRYGAELCREGSRLLGGAIPDTGEKTCPVEIARHVRSHGTQTNESHAHCMPSITAGAAGGEL